VYHKIANYKQSKKTTYIIDKASIMSAEEPPQNRYSRWFGTLACSIIAIVALSTGFSGLVSDQNAKGVWAFSALIITMIISGLAVLAHMVKQEFAGTHVEAGLVSNMVPSCTRRNVRQCADSIFSVFMHVFLTTQAVIVLAIMICSLPVIMVSPH
jgi:hypothetical protein